MQTSLENEKQEYLKHLKKCVGNSSLEMVPPPDELKQDEKFFLEAAKITGAVLKYASDELKQDKNFFLEAAKITNTGAVLQYASDELKNNRDFVLKMVQVHGIAFKYASDELKKDQELFLEAYKNFFPAARELVSPEQLELFKENQSFKSSFEQQQTFWENLGDIPSLPSSSSHNVPVAPTLDREHSTSTGNEWEDLEYIKEGKSASSGSFVASPGAVQVAPPKLERCRSSV